MIRFSGGYLLMFICLILATIVWLAMELGKEND